MILGHRRTYQFALFVIFFSNKLPVVTPAAEEKPPAAEEKPPVSVVKVR